ncbi:aminomethyl transferase family protein [Blautia liquoris]|uniref:Aminomethyl transferase family protein n=1 Tax=Blautia liquoris TaxID=2779518 RepID=A0A7M2RGK1_9FIRM|nr:aminomethyl transferase family protein [Blautia liquoris]QOV19369.1 aminomethyl transferase family protein [Blautia liquoris]
MSNEVKKDVLDVEPYYPDVYKYGNIMTKHITWEGDPWYEVGQSYFENSYIHAGLSGLEETFKGPDAAKLLSDCSINNVYKWKSGKCKHLVALTPDGLVANHALFFKDAEESFRTTAGCSVPYLTALQSGSYQCEYLTKKVFIFQFSGPLSLTILEKSTQTSLRDVKFLDFCPVSIPGIEAELEICRIGMSGTLAYEVHGPAELGPAVYDHIYQIGKPMGMKRMGWKDYTVNHTFGGFAQMTVNFETSLYQSPEFCANAPFPMVCKGSVDPKDIRARFRTPLECDWAWMAKLDHEFVGRETLENEIANPKRKLVTLEFNTDDLADVYRSQFTDSPYKYMDMPCADPQPAGGHQDYVTDKDGNVIGISADPTFSSHFHTMISHAILDVDQIEEGKEVLVQWGDYGKKIKNLRASIARFPYIHGVMDNRDYDLSTVPSGIE